jgi:hypothetical protein
MRIHFLLTILLTFFALTASAQTEVYKYKSTSIAIKDIGAGETKFKHSDCNLLIVFNFENDRITVFSEETQKFDIVRYGEFQKDEDGDKVLKMKAVDSDGASCTLEFVDLVKERDNRKQLYVRYSNINYVYNIYSAN